MKFIFCVLSLSAMVLFLGSMQAKSTDDAKSSGPEVVDKMCHENLKKCQTTTKATADDVKQMCEENKLPTTKTGKCLVDCTLREYHFMTDDGFQKDAFMKKVEGGLGSDKNGIKVVQEIANECEKKKDTKDKCETSYLVAKCFLDAAKKKGLPA